MLFVGDIYHKAFQILLIKCFMKINPRKNRPTNSKKDISTPDITICRN